MIVVQSEARLHPADLPALREAAAAFIAATRQEPGCIAYHLAEDWSEPGLVHSIERWTDRDAVEAHLESAHVTAFIAVVSRLRCDGLRVIARPANAMHVLLDL